MSAHQLITGVTWSVFVVLFVITSAEAIRRPSRTHIDIALLFTAPAIVVAMALSAAAGVLARNETYRAIFAGFQLALPYMTLRLAQDFAQVPTWVSRTALLSGAGLIAASFFVTAEARPWLFQLQLTYFVSVQIYSAVIFAGEARHAAGITRRRLRSAAAGAMLLGLAPLATLFRSSGELWLTMYELANLGAGICYFLGFAPPGRVRRSWQEPELRAFLRTSTGLAHFADEAEVLRALEQGAAGALGAPYAQIGLWDADHGLLRFDRAEQPLPGGGESAAERAFRSQRPQRVSAAGRQRAQGGGATLVAPLTADQRRFGVIAVATPREALFTRDDLEVVELLASQAATVLESRALIADLAHVQAREEATRMKDDFLSAAAHDLKTPLTTLVAQAQLLERRMRRRPDAPPDARSVSLLVESAERLRERVHTLLEAAHARREPPIARRAVFDLGELARQVIEPYDSELHPCTLRAEAHVSSSGDRERLAQLLGYLLDNAVKFSPQGGTIEVGVRANDGEALLSVSDHGIGIAASDLPHLFERFHRGANVDDRRFAGMGLSFAIGRAIVEQHGGRIWVESQLGTGTTVTVALPLVREGAEHEA